MITKRAVSDMVGAIIMIAIVIVGFAGIVYPFLLRYQSSAQGALKASQQEALQSETMMTPVYSYTEQSNGTTYFYVYLYNYGRVSFTPQYFIVSMLNAGLYEITNFSIINAQSGYKLTSIPPGAVVEVEFSIPYSKAVPSAYNLTAVGDGISLTWCV